MKILTGHTNSENAHTVDNWPWGFKLKTQKRFWIETNEKHGQRFCSQTMNPKNNTWCKPKKSTYNQICMIAQDPENGHISHFGLSKYGHEKAADFLEKYRDSLDDYQQRTLQAMDRSHKAYQKAKEAGAIKWTINGRGA